MLRWFLDELGIEVAFDRASDHDFRGAKSDLVLDMCLQLGATRYVFGALGRDYADTAAFAAAGVEAVFQEYRHPAYPQLHGAFEPYMSIVDLLFNCGDESAGILTAGQPDPLPGDVPVR